MANHHGPFDDKNADRRRSEIFDAFRKHFGEGDGAAMSPTVPLGAQGDYPAGMYGGDDEGSIAFGVAPDIDNRRVVLNFGKEVAWLGMEPNQAVHLAEALIKAARATSTKPIAISIR